MEQLDVHMSPPCTDMLKNDHENLHHAPQVINGLSLNAEENKQEMGRVKYDPSAFIKKNAT